MKSDFACWSGDCAHNVLGFPRSGKWIVRFNSGAAVYDPEFKNGDSFDTIANPGQKDGLNFNADVGIGPYSVVILSQD